MTDDQINAVVEQIRAAMFRSRDMLAKVPELKIVDAAGDSMAVCKVAHGDSRLLIFKAQPVGSKLPFESLKLGAVITEVRTKASPKTRRTNRSSSEQKLERQRERRAAKRIAGPTQ